MPMEFLGDGLYVKKEHDQVVLYAHNGICATNTVYLDAIVLKAFLIWLDRNSKVKINDC